MTEKTRPLLPTQSSRCAPVGFSPFIQIRIDGGNEREPRVLTLGLLLNVLPAQAQGPTPCRFLCAPEFKVEPTLTFTTLFNSPRIIRDDGVSTRDQRETDVYRPLTGVPDQSQIVVVDGITRGEDDQRLSYPGVREIQRALPNEVAVLAYTYQPFALATGEHAERMWGFATIRAYSARPSDASLVARLPSGELPSARLVDMDDGDIVYLLLLEALGLIVKLRR